jgi:hypothetical protein
MRLLTATLAALALAATAAEARNVPVGFYGVSYDGELRTESAAFQAGAWRRMAATRVESARTVFSWGRAQSQEGQPFDFHQSDVFVRHAAENGIDLLPIVQDTPLWARSAVTNWWPRRSSDYAMYVEALVARYGPDGSYWADNPDVPVRPIRHWQIFNEPGRSMHYGPLLDAAYDAIKGADPGAKVVLAGLTGTEEGSPWDVLDYQYRRGGISGSFDIAAMHLYTGKPENVVEGLRLFRGVMKRRGDGRKPVWLTEFGITASKGRTKAPRSQRTLRTTDRGMASFLHEAYRRLARRDRKLRLERAYWYTWASSYEKGAGIFRFAGLYRYSGGSYFRKPALAKYRASARRDQAG